MVTVEDGLVAVRIVLAVEQAAGTGQTVHVWNGSRTSRRETEHGRYHPTSRGACDEHL